MNRHVWMIVAVLAYLCSASAAVADTAPEYFNIPTGYDAGGGIAPASDGTVWFGSTLATGRTPIPSPGTTNGMATFPTPTQPGTSCCANALRSVAFDTAHNRLWFGQNDGIVGYANPSLASPGTSAGIVDTRLPYGGDLWDIAVGASGLAWFTEANPGNPGYRIATANGTGYWCRSRH